MQQSFGEQIVTINSGQVGKVRVLNAYAYPSICPCLGIMLGITLSPSQQRLQGVPTPTDFQLHELHGELRLSELVDSVGELHWVGNRQRVRSIGHEMQISMTCDLDALRLQSIETWRDGRSPKFWIQLWPSLVGKEEWYDAEIRGFTAEIPQQAWLDMLAKWGMARWNILEVPYSSVDEERFTTALGYLAKARHWLDRGEYDEAVGACRLAIDAMFKDLAVDGKRNEFAEYLSPGVPEARGKEYASLLTALKEIAHKPHHISSAGKQYLRAEAVFAIQTMQHLMALVGAVTSTQRGPKNNS